MLHESRQKLKIALTDTGVTRSSTNATAASTLSYVSADIRVYSSTYASWSFLFSDVISTYISIKYESKIFGH